nr:hypothetical protein Iba_chr03dCG4800 [Ipomoea batatas]
MYMIIFYSPVREILTPPCLFVSHPPLALLLLLCSSNSCMSCGFLLSMFTFHALFTCSINKLVGKLNGVILFYDT